MLLKIISVTNSIFTTQGAVISQFLRIKENFTKVLIAQSFWADKVGSKAHLLANEGTGETNPTNTRRTDAQISAACPFLTVLGWGVWKIQIQNYIFKSFK